MTTEARARKVIEVVEQLMSRHDSEFSRSYEVFNTSTYTWGELLDEIYDDLVEERTDC